jgi:hypothetical protein
VISQNAVTHLQSEPLDSLTHQRHSFRVFGSQIFEEFWRIAMLYLAFRQKRPICKPLRLCHQTTVIVNDVLGQMFIRCSLSHQITSQNVEILKAERSIAVGHFFSAAGSSKVPFTKRAMRIIDQMHPI